MPINYKEYPPNWKTEIRPRILERAGHCCEFCGVPNYTKGIRSLNKLLSVDEYIEDNGWNSDVDIIAKYGKNHNTLREIKIVLTIAHLDHDKENWEVSDDRLAALCQRCHLWYDAPQRKRNRNPNQLKLFKQ